MASLDGAVDDRGMKQTSFASLEYAGKKFSVDTRAAPTLAGHQIARVAHIVPGQRVPQCRG